MLFMGLRVYRPLNGKHKKTFLGALCVFAVKVDTRVQRARHWISLEGSVCFLTDK